MSRPPLSLTAELEKLEQSITLTLQEIDHNFSRAHRIVTTSIIPIVERYARESEAVWEGSKFWKQFFEASANVALSNYQEDEGQGEGGEAEQTATTYAYEETNLTGAAETYITASSPGNYGEQSARITLEDDPRHRRREGGDEDEDYLLDDSLLDSLDLTGVGGSTPKAKGKSNKEGKEKAQWEDIESPFEKLRRELAGKDYTIHGSPPPAAGEGLDGDDTNVDVDMDTEDPTLPPTTPQTSRRTRPLAKDSLFSTPTSSPFHQPATARKTPGATNEDHLLHRVLDKNWRLQATPLGKPPTSKYRTVTTTPKPQILVPPASESPMSSPPKPHFYYSTDIFSSPIPGFSGKLAAPKTPTTTSRRYGNANVSTHHYREDSRGGGGGGGGGEYRSSDDDDDSDELDLPPGFSPPVTIQFSLPPSKLLATPAREASRRIVHDILQTAGAADESGATDSSPPVVRGVGSSLNDTF